MVIKGTGYLFRIRGTYPHLPFGTLAFSCIIDEITYLGNSETYSIDYTGENIYTN